MFLINEQTTANYSETSFFKEALLGLLQCVLQRLTSEQTGLCEVKLDGEINRADDWIETLQTLLLLLLLTNCPIFICTQQQNKVNNKRNKVGEKK